MIFVLFQSRHDNDRHDAFDALDPDRHASAVDRILASLLLAHAKLGSESLLIRIVLAVQQPRAGSPSQYTVALPLDPDLIIRSSSRADSRLEQDLAAVRKRNGDQSRLLCRKWQKSCVKQMTQLPCIFCSEGL